MMNYVGSISILDRGDAPAQAIIDKNARSLAQRVADETRDELEKVMSRVDNIYESYEASTQALMEQSTLEYVEDIAELEALIKDQIKKKKYQQQVTIFIVGYENVCGQKLRLLQQVNEFFMDNSKSYEEEDWYPKTPDIDLDDCSTKIEESLSTAKELTEKISTINNDMVEWLTTYAINKASTKSKKKLESALSKAKDDVKAITDQLKSALLANDEKDDLIQTYLKQLEGKTLEAQKFKAAAEVAKKNVQGLEAKELVYQDEIEKRTSAMKQLQEDLRKIQMDASQSKFLSDLNSNRLKSKDSETAENKVLPEVKFEELQTVIEKHKLELQESKRELQAIHQDQIKALHDTQTADLEAVRLEYADMIKKLQDDLHEAKLKVDETEGLVADAADAAEQARQELITLQLSGSTGDSRPTTEIESQPPDAEDDGISRDSSRQKKKLRFDRSKSRSRSRESRPSTKDTRSSKGTAAKVTVTRTTPAAKVATKPAKPESKSPVKPVKETADASIQDEGGDPGSAHVETRQSKRARSTLETVKESDLSADFDDAFDLADENSWALVPVETVPGRFSQYRKMTIRRLSELEEQLGLTVAKTQRKVTTLKSQFQEHKSKWETERKVLIEQVEQAQKLQTEAEKEADVAMTQLEEFINEQERLEEEEEVKRQEVVKGVSKPVMVSIPTQNDDDETVESEVITSSSPQTLTPEQPGAETGAPPPTFVQSEESEHELTNLMQQTDDAKYERQRSDSKVISRRSSSVNSDVAPWLLAAEKKSRLADNDNEEEEEEEEETVARSSASKTSFRTKSERIASEMSKLEEPDEAEEDENEENYEKDEDFVTDEDNIVKEGTITSKKSHSSQERRSVASKLSKKTLSRNTTREETQEVFRSGEATPGEEGNDGAVELDQESKESRSSKVPSQIESERSKVTQEGQRSKSKISVSQDEVQRSPSQAGEAGETEEETVLQPGSHNRSRRGSRQSRSQTRSNMKRRSSVKSIERAESQKSKMSESGAASRKSNQSIGTPRKSDQEGSNISRRMSDLDLEDESAQMVEDGKVESRKSNSDVLSRRSTQLSKHLTVEEIGDVVIAEDSVLTERSRGDGEMYSEETEDEPIFDVQVVTQDKSDSRASRQHMSVDISLEPLSRSGTAQDQYASPRSLSKVQEMNRKSSGALSAPPAIEPESEIRDKTRSSMSAPRSPPLSRSRGSVVSQYVTRGMTGTTPIEELSEVGSVCTGKSRSRSRSAGSGASKEWILHVTPRYRSRQGSAMSGHDTIDALIVEDNLPQCQSSALHNMKSMMEEENMSNIQHHTLESVRSALKTLNKKDQELSALQLERTITLISLASQLTEESIQLGVLPESVFDAFAEINSRAMSKMSHREEDYLIDDAQGTEFLQPTTQGSVLTEQSLTNETSSGSLKQLPPLESFLLSGQSQRLMGSRQRSLKLSSAPLDMSKYQERARTDSNMALQGPLMTFATMATGGSTRKSSPITPRPKSVTKLLSRSQLSRTKRADIGLTFGSPEYFEYPGNEEGYLYHGIKVCDHGTSPIFQLILYDNGTSPMYQICDGSDDITVTSDPAIVPHLPETVENSDRSENIESSDLSEIIENCNKSENGQNSGHSEILDNGDKFENVENLNKTELENLEMSGDIENNDQSEILSDEMISLERLENVQKSEIQTAFDSTKQGGLQTLEVLTNSVTMEMNENSDMIDPSPFALTEQQDNSLIEQSKMCSGDFNKSQASNENQSENVIESTSPNQSKQSSYDKTNQNENQTEGTNSGEKISQSNLKVSLSVSDCSTKVESKGSSAGSRSEVMDSKYVKKVDITYLTDQHADDKDDEENWNSNHVDEIEVKGQRDSDQNPDTLPSHINENIETDDFRNDTIRIGSKQKQFVPDVKTQRKVIRSEVRIPEVMTQQFDPSLYDREKLKVTGLPFKKDDNFSEVGYYVSPSSRKPSKVRRSKISDSELSGRTLVLAPEPTQLEREPVSLIIKKAEVSSQFNVDTTRLESCERQIVDTEVGEELSVKKSFSKTDRVENFRPVQQFRETIEENSVLTIHTEMQGIMGDCVTHPETQTQIVPKTEEELRATSALSRASLRKEYRNKLGEVRAAVEDRRTKSPAISIPSQRSLEDDQLIDEDDDDDIPYNDIEDMKREQTMEMGTSPPPGHKGQSSSRLSQTSVDHPVVTEYLRLYDGVVQFRNALSKLMIDRDMLQPGEILEDIDTMKFNSAVKVEPQIEGMTHNVYHVFEEIISVLSSLLLADREPMVSSLTGGGMMISRDTTQAVVGPKSAESGRGPTVTRASHHSQFSAKSDVSDRIALRELQEQYDRLQHQLTSDTRKHEEQLRHNTVVMMEMQDTINDLQRELANLGRSSSRLRPQSDTTSPHGTTDSAIMFTRLDSERNSKIMKRAVNDQKMNADAYKDAVVKMEDYVGLPAQRFAHLVRKYVHHSRMKEIEENVKKSRSLNENVFEILDKMEALQNERAKTWADKMDQMGSERLRLANLLMETLDSIEQESGIFLIKPMYSYRGRDIKDARYGGKLTRPMRPQRNISPTRENQSSFAPAPTPASNMRLIRGQPVPTTQSMTHETTMAKQEVPRPLEGDEGGITGSSLNWVGTSQKQTWSMNSSVVRGDPESFLSSQNPNAMNTPRILELDINRMLIGQNTISSKITQPGMTEDRLVNASQNNLRSYITVNRPTAVPGNARPRSFASSATKEYVPPSSPVSQNTKRVRMSEGDMSRADMSRNMTNTPPLPPIGSASSREMPGEPPRSPPGSSMRQSPPHVQEVISPLK